MALYAASLVAVGSASAVLPAGQTLPSRNTPKPPSGKPAARPEPAMPFSVGEKLNYRIAWATFNQAATLELSVPEKRMLFGWDTWHFRAAFHTVKPVRTLFAIDDEFDSYTDTTTLESRQYESYLNELGKTYNTVLHLAPRGTVPRAPGGSVLVPPGTRDPLGTLFALRGVDWQHTPEVQSSVYDGQTLYQLEARDEARDDLLSVDRGSFHATRIGVSVYQNQQENAAIHFTVWLSNDPGRVPVQITAELPFGTLHVELISIDPVTAR